ncbi:MAG: hypothetical protein JSV79_13245 [Armatimonadota bacterium]|nr:MAG: hypothetical protein JSV79_13245 [Armatimonadota bacterium]
MESELDLLLGTAINSLVKLEAALFLHSRPGSALAPHDISVHLRRPVSEVTAALDELSQSQLIERFPFGTGRHVVYGPTEDSHVGALLDLLYERYNGDSESRSRVVRQTLRAQ